MNLEQIKEKVKNFKVEVPSWGFGRSGTRFHAFHILGEARDVYEKMDDAALVNKVTDAVSAVAIHIPWDKVDDYKALKEYTENKGLKIGAVNPNYFEDEDYLYGSLSNSNIKIRRKAIEQTFECIEIMRQTDSKVLSMWIPDGSNYPGQIDFKHSFELLENSLKQITNELDNDMTMLLEYKFFEPAFYSTLLCDWGTSYMLSKALEEKVKVLVDLGHHPQGTNIEYIVSLMSFKRKLGGFHFNSRKYADDDLTVGSLNPYELFLIFVELNKYFDLSLENQEISLVLDQSHNIKPKIPAVVQSLNNLQITYAKSLVVDYEQLRQAQDEQDVIKAEEILKSAYETDVRGILRELRKEKGLPEDPINNLLQREEYKRIIKERI
ncbi:TIM barrel protein [Petrotoga sp. 9PWA.NaAc.5.4]|uniref:TIM barrel protein n=1 Tax=Petrotoga sp. 9PWA.NaAc.5.4 TaxID=1434328 RepID=UPI000CC3D71E|nr:TIM barrel protein [Petrotoga sp. 9PWA.NaAc.5.4]PNR95791.1 sugar isomerase [Petrotoga sp. 9PWA.NaAc.5.4]